MIDAGSFSKPIKFRDHPKSRVAWYWKDIHGFLQKLSVQNTHSNVKFLMGPRCDSKSRHVYSTNAKTFHG